MTGTLGQENHEIKSGRETQQDPVQSYNLNKANNNNKNWMCSSVAQHKPSTHEILGSTPTTTKRNLQKAQVPLTLSWSL